MADLTEQQIFSCMTENFRLAAEACDRLAVTPISGTSYKALRESLAMLEGTCRQAAVWRQDCRWYDIGLLMAEAHKRAGNWLRGAVDPVTGYRIKLAEVHRYRNFNLLADNLRKAEKRAIECRDRKTGRVGMILPEAYTRSKPSGLIHSAAA